MKLVIIEPLGVEKERLLSMAEEALKGRAEIIYYDTRVTDTQEPVSYTHLTGNARSIFLRNAVRMSSFWQKWMPS